MTHASVPPEIRAKLGISDSLVRLSIGIEDVADIKKDLDNALKAAMEAVAAADGAAGAGNGVAPKA
jgi:cystathionine gamma-lyase